MFGYEPLTTLLSTIFIPLFVFPFIIITIIRLFLLIWIISSVEFKDLHQLMAHMLIVCLWYFTVITTLEIYPFRNTYMVLSAKYIVHFSLYIFLLIELLVLLIPFTFLEISSFGPDNILKRIWENFFFRFFWYFLVLFISFFGSTLWKNLKVQIPKLTYKVHIKKKISFIISMYM